MATYDSKELAPHRIAGGAVANLFTYLSTNDISLVYLELAFKDGQYVLKGVRTHKEESRGPFAFPSIDGLGLRAIDAEHFELIVWCGADDFRPVAQIAIYETSTHTILNILTAAPDDGKQRQIFMRFPAKALRVTYLVDNSELGGGINRVPAHPQ